MRYWPGCIAAIALLLASTTAATAASAIQCHSKVGDGTGWVWRLIDGKRCWFQGSRLTPKGRLTWRAPQRRPLLTCNRSGDMKEVYLGDGLYASFDGYMICLRAPRGGGDHVVYLEAAVLEAFEKFVADLRAPKQPMQVVEPEMYNDIDRKLDASETFGERFKGGKP